MDLGSRQRWAVCTSETAGFKANSETASCLQISQRSTHQLAPRLPLAADRRASVKAYGSLPHWNGNVILAHDLPHLRIRIGIQNRRSAGRAASLLSTRRETLHAPELRPATRG